MRRNSRILAILLGCATFIAGSEIPTAPASSLAAKCAACHSARTKTSGFSVESTESVLAGGNKYGPAVVAGHPEQSVLVKMLRGEMQPRMPLGDPLPEAEIAKIEEWIRKMPPVAAQANEDSRWAFQKPEKQTPPVVKDSAWVRNPIDAFVLARLEKEGLAPAPPAAKATLIRRVFFDLIGLPPGPEEMEALLKDESAGWYTGLIDRLLADPRYGERWGRHWLDLARYGETTGLEGDGMIGNAWRYRDWVIEAFNSNMPYDRFVTLQIAGGDEHSRTRNNYQPDPQGLIPTGFLRTAPWDKSNLVAAEVRQNYLSEVTSTVSSVFLGLTVGCARCHDHKYDPIPQKDYYRLQAFFQATQAGGPVEVPYEDPEFAEKAKQKVEELQKRVKEGPEKQALDAYEAELLQKLIAARKGQAEGKKYEAEDLRLELKLKPLRIFSEEERDRHAELLEDATRTGDSEEKAALDVYETVLLKKLEAAYSGGSVDPLKRFEALDVKDVRAEATSAYSGRSIFSEDEKNRHAEMSGALDILERRIGRWKPMVLCVTNVAGPPTGPDIAPTHVLVRGDVRQPGEAVEPGFPSAVTGNGDPAELVTDRYRQFVTRGRRITLAKWIASKENPLTARVMVNRMWQYHFGNGIVRTSSDFGRNGDRPSHPELLDWLAVEFMESGWDVKRMHKLMLESSTYRQAAENPVVQVSGKDPDNRLMGRYERRRLEAEAIRDSILSVSGRLDPQMRGPSVFPPLPDDLADFARYGRTGGLMWEPNETEADARRRSVYIFQRRSLPLPMMAAFDSHAFSESCERRSQTTTPLQALSMMNGYLVHEESAQLAKRVEREAGADQSAQIRRLFKLTLNRAPSADEVDRFASLGDLAGAARVLLNSNEFLYVE